MPAAKPRRRIFREPASPAESAGQAAEVQTPETAWTNWLFFAGFIQLWPLGLVHHLLAEWTCRRRQRRGEPLSRHLRQARMLGRLSWLHNLLAIAVVVSLVQVVGLEMIWEGVRHLFSGEVF